jgi:cardiolipin synthase (CMP-forming)
MTSRILTIPNLLTLARLIAVPVFLWASFQGRFTLAFVLFVSAALTDLFDGLIARRFNQRSRLGALLDPAADKTIMVCGYLFYTLRQGLAVPIPPWVTFAILIRDFMIVVFAYLLFTRVNVKRFPPSWAGKTSTVTQAVTLGCVIAVNAFFHALEPALQILFRIVVVITLYSAWDYLRRGRRLLDELMAAG